MADIFLSYKRDDLNVARRLVERLRSAGLSVWWDQDVAPDAPWEATIERELEAAKVVIVAWSKAAVASDNVKAEARRARGQGKLIQVFVERCEPPLFFGERQGVDLSGWNGNDGDSGFQTVLVAARAVLAGKRPPPGVGYAPRKQLPWARATALFLALSGVLGLLANLGGARDTLCSLGLKAVCAASPAAAVDEDAVLQNARVQLLTGLDGAWSRSDRDCSIPVIIRSETDAAGISRIRLETDDYEGLAQVVSAEGGTVVTQGISQADRGIWRYRPDGDRMTVTDPNGTETALTRCPN